MKIRATLLIAALFAVTPNVLTANAWFDETHLAIAKAAGYRKWFNAAAADIARTKIGGLEGFNHFANCTRGTLITPEMVLRQAERYDTLDPQGHLCGAIIGSLRVFQAVRNKTGHADPQLAYLVHYIGDLSMPLHHTINNSFNRKHHLVNDGIINFEALTHFRRIKIYPIDIRSEKDLAAQIARIANLSKNLGYQLEDQNRRMTHAEAYCQIAHSASLLRAVLAYLRIDVTDIRERVESDQD